MTEEKSINKYPRGSIWRKWDLHVHSPASFDYQDRSITNEKIIEKFKESNISVVAITDHHFIDVERIKRLQNLGKQQDITIFPGIELRSELGGSESVHFIGIFPENCNLNEIWTDIQSNCKLQPSQIQSIGNDKIYSDLKDTCDLIHDLGGIVTIHAGGKSNSIESIKNNQEFKKFLKKEIAEKYVDILELGNKYDIKDCNEIIFPNIGFKLPMIICSDNHKILDYNLKENCWIKANPTFEGLKQIVYEPEDRVKIQELKPEEKEDYQVIDRVKFIDDSFTPDEILINQNLTTIIGGKSTGKSILLRNIAQTIDPVEVLKRLNEVGITPYSKEVSDFNVIWKDKQENKKNEDNGANKKIIYIPQSYLNRLVDKKEDKTSIDDIIKNVLEQEEDVKIVFSQLQSQNREVEKILTQNIEDLFYKENDIKNLIESIKKIGDKKGIESEIEKLKKEVAELKKKAGMTDEEISKYNKLLEEITVLRKEQEKADKNLNILKKLQTAELSKLSILSKEIYGNLIFSLSSEIEKSLNIALDEISKTANEEWILKLEEEHKKVEVIKNENQSKLEKLYEEFNPLLEKAKKSKSLNEKIEKTDAEEKKLKEIKEQETNRQILKFNYEKLIKDISKNHSKFFDNLFDAKTEILKQRSITEDQDLEFGIEIIFENKSFQENCINDICDQRKLSQFEDGFLQDYKYSNKANFKNDIEKITKEILNEKLILKNSYSRKEAITRLVQNWLIFDYKIKQNGDEIMEMSPGKKSFVLLKLLIELDNSKCPILLDQPEDDLDNRSIYNELVQFIKTKKKERQIIIATHNPNLVVGADSECVIVANQAGDQSKNETYPFEYVQGALENKFTILTEEKVLYKQGIQEHVCDILEGGKIAFEQRRKKYNI